MVWSIFGQVVKLDVWIVEGLITPVWWTHPKAISCLISLTVDINV